MKWECYDARQDTTEDRDRLAQMVREDWRITEVLANGMVYLRRQVPEPPEPGNAPSKFLDLLASRKAEIRTNTLKEVGAWLRDRVGNVWTLEQLHAFQRGELPK